MNRLFLNDSSRIFSGANPFEVSDFVNRHVGSHELRMSRHHDSSASLQHRKVGALNLCRLSYGTQARIVSEGLPDIYHLQFILRGHCRYELWRDSLSLPAGHVLVWSDEFDQPGLPDAAKWAHDTERNRLGWYNNELQYYAANRPENAQVRDGRLHVTARLESLASLPDWGGQRYTSARLLTRGRADWTYGYFEVRAKMPCGRGTWPAIWLLGSGGRWPEDGELDMVEQLGSDVLGQPAD